MNPLSFAIVALGILFVGLKLAGIITWSWWLVALPFYVGIPIAIFFVVVVLVFAIIAKALEK